MFPMFVLIPDEGMICVVENEQGLSLHEAIDVAEELYWVWTALGDRYRLVAGDEGGYLLEPAPTQELQLFGVIAHWCIRWQQQQVRWPPRFGDYAILVRWLKDRSL